MKDRKLLLLIFVAFVIRVVWFFVYSPSVYYDTGEFEVLARQIASMDFVYYYGRRTPGYSLIMLLGGLNHHVIFCIQMLMGILASVFLYKTFQAFMRSEWICFAAGLSYSLLPSQLFSEGNMLAETSCVFFITFVVMLVSKIIEGRMDKDRYYLLLGLVSAFLLLIKPIFQFTSIITLLFLFAILVRRRDHAVVIVKKLMLFFIPCILFVMTWASFNKYTLDVFVVDPVGGLILTQHAVRCVESFPPEYRDLEEIHNAAREEMLQTYGREAYDRLWLEGDLIEHSHRRMMKHRNMTFAELSRLMFKMCAGVFIEHPFLYMKSVMRSFILFWKHAFIYKVKIPYSEIFLSVYKYFYAGVIGFFLLFPVLRIFIKKIRRIVPFSAQEIYIYMIVFTVALIQALACSNPSIPRYKIPVEPFVISISVSFLLALIFGMRNPGHYIKQAETFHK